MMMAGAGVGADTSTHLYEHQHQHHQQQQQHHHQHRRHPSHPLAPPHALPLHHHPAATDLASSPPASLAHANMPPPPPSLAATVGSGVGPSSQAYQAPPQQSNLSQRNSGSQRSYPNGRPINGQHGRSRHNSNQFEGARSPPNSKSKDLSHVPCKFFRVGQCQAGNACPFSHDFENGEQPCKYFAKGNCKFGPKCANLHVDQYGRVVNRPQKSLAAFNISGRSDPLGFQSPQLTGMPLPSEDGAVPAAFMNQIPPLSDLDPSGGSGTKPFDIPGSQIPFGSPSDESRFPMSPPLIRNINEVGLPSSFDSKGSSSMFKRGPVAASVPSKFFTIGSPPSSMSNNGSLLTAEAVRGLRDSGIDSRSKVAQFGSSPLGMMEEEPAPRLMHSQRLRPRGPGGMMSSSLPVREEWETVDEDDLFGDQEEYVPTELLNSQILNKADRDAIGGGREDLVSSAPRDFVRNGGADGGAGLGSPDFGPKIGSPSMASPGSSRFTDLFNEQKRREASGSFSNSGSAFGPVGSPLRSSGFNYGGSPGGSRPGHADSVSALTAELKRTRITRGTSTDSGSSPALGAVGSSRRLAEPRMSTDRTISSGSVAQRIDEEAQVPIFSLEVDELTSRPGAR